jgi:hypothetical protein
MEYNDLIELARLCLRQADAARTPEAADALRRMAKDCEARAAALMGGESPVGQGDPPRPESPSMNVQSSLPTPKRP